jgi:hypothetical protein
MRFDMFIAKILLASGRRPNFSTSIAEETTAGFGQLDEFGFWQYPLSSQWINNTLNKSNLTVEGQK